MFKSLIEGKKGVFFDLDGTLIDSEPLWVLAFDAVLRKADPSVPLEGVYELPGESLYDKWKRIVTKKLIKTQQPAEELTEATHKEFLRLIEDHGIDARDGFWELAFELKEEKGFKLALATNTDESVAKIIVEKLGLDKVFDFIIYGNQVKRRKPDPEMYLTAAKQLGLSPKEVLVFEDSIFGAAAAEKAGMSLVLIWDNQTAKTEFPKDTLLFLQDFMGLAGNLDMTPKEMFDQIKEKLESKQSK
ncbi:hypothetical protein A2415_05125 [candidate division WWE3 bacterium RIFOXYC1_FULL_39_7]|uniref:Uncharacterized protein n=2 Tax=Katanobacteria TaxID=422282 RepID=A0A1F4X7P8_UNCKA|nr:MAG: hypothetical protein A2415_05125 [candidate division WWE3 bacterium RIFOXYC1_FULL_39_7]OGC77735.1 MAG: hypothetical protein A2619_03595 [candidate division WWE3 bacterium RIFOXYD1_FULL_39_9]